MKYGRLILVLAVLSNLILNTDNLHANGGPVAWTGVTPVGAFGLAQDYDIVLKSENLKIDITGFNTYKVRAVYELQNDGGEKTVVYGVPVTWAEMDPDDPWSEKKDLAAITARSRKNAEKLQDTVSIKLNGQDIYCGLSESAFSDTTKKLELGLSSNQANNSKEEQGLTKTITNLFKKNEDDKPDQYLEEDNTDSSQYAVRTWCVATLPFKSKSKNEVILEYSGELFYTDMAYSKSSLTTFGTRKLSYLFYPAGFWKGPVKTVNIKVNTGPFPFFRVFNGPSGSQINGRTIVWSLNNIDFKKLPRLDILLPAEPVSKNELLTWNQLADTNWGRIVMKVKTSITLPDSGKNSYKAENVLDGRGETAWCKGTAGSGVGQWLQFNIADNKVQPSNSDKVALESTEGSQKYQCRIEGLVFTPGYLKSQKSYEANARIRKVRITDCDGKQPFDIAINPPKDFELAPLFLPEHKAEQAFASIKKSGCFRLTIQEIDKGSSDDVCVSEVSLIRHCY